MNKNIFTDYRPLFNIEKIYQQFYNDQHKILYTITKLLF